MVYLNFIHENFFEECLFDYCEKYNIENIKNESQSTWNGLLFFIRDRYFKGSDRLLLDSCKDTFYNEYDPIKVKDLADIYINYSTVYDKEISLLGFSNLTSISRDTMYQWLNGNSRKDGEASKILSDTTKRIIEQHERSLSDKLASGKQNPVGVIAILNHTFNWSSPYASDANKDKQPTIEAIASAHKLCDNGKQLAIPDTKL